MIFVGDFCGFCSCQVACVYFHSLACVYFHSLVIRLGKRLWTIHKSLYKYGLGQAWDKSTNLVSKDLSIFC